MSFPDAFADVVLSSAVLHFARDDEHFRAMLHGSWRVLKPGGLFFCRLASTIGMEDRMRRIDGRRFLLPDGSERYLVDEALLMQLTDELGGPSHRPAENHRRARSTLHDHLGGAQERLTISPYWPPWPPVSIRC